MKLEQDLMEINFRFVLILQIKQFNGNCFVISIYDDDKYDDETEERFKGNQLQICSYNAVQLLESDNENVKKSIIRNSVQFNKTELNASYKAFYARTGAFFQKAKQR
ncbi:hypothetical protein DOY81_005655 [Sarcophaga bullata]|nr:hypothetical protein DOY81_005655 [Sarcophaga bullata]